MGRVIDVEERVMQKTVNIKIRHHKFLSQLKKDGYDFNIHKFIRDKLDEQIKSFYGEDSELLGDEETTN